MGLVNLTNISNAPSPLDFVVNVNVAAEGAYSLGMLLSIFVVLLIASSRYGMIKALAVAGWGTFVMSVLFYAIRDGAGNHLGNFYVSLVMLIIAAGMGVKLYFEKGS